MMFAARLPELREEIRRILRDEAFPSYQAIEAKLGDGEALDLVDACGLLLRCIGSERLLYRLLKQVASLREARFHNELRLIIPQYQSSYCVDDCAYCGFRQSNADLLRSRLSAPDFRAETELIMDWGYRCIEFVYATDQEFSAHRIGRRAEEARRLAAGRDATLRLGLNANVFGQEEYRDLAGAGIDFVVLWMETYSERYHRWHPGKGPKADFQNRLNGHDHAMSAGLDRCGLGVLFGLGPWLEDALALVAHGLYLRSEYGRDPWILGIPRVRPAMGVHADRSPFSPSDGEFLLVCAVYKAVFPDVMLFINTREPLELNLEIARGGGDLFTIDCATYPGGYLFGGPQRAVSEQFKTYFYSRERTIDELEGQGFRPLYGW